MIERSPETMRRAQLAANRIRRAKQVHAEMKLLYEEAVADLNQAWEDVDNATKDEHRIVTDADLWNATMQLLREGGDIE